MLDSGAVTKPGDLWCPSTNLGQYMNTPENDGTCEKISFNFKHA